MSSVSTLTRGNFTQHRKVTGAPVAADSADLATIDRRAILRTEGVEGLQVYVRLAGGAAPTVDLIPLLYDKDSDSFAALPKKSGVKDGEIFTLDVYELPIFFRIDAVANNPTSAEIRVASGSLSAHA